MNKTNALIYPDDDFSDGFHMPNHAEYASELSAGPFKFKSHSQNADGSGSAINGALAGGAIAIGAVAVVLAILFGGGGSK